MSGAPQEIGERALIRELGDNFEARGWDDRESLALAIVNEARDAGGRLDPVAAAGLASSVYLARNGIDIGELEEAITKVFGARRLLPVERDYPQVTQVSKIEVHGDHNTLSDVATGEQSVSIDSGTPKGEILEAVSELVLEGLRSGLPIKGLEELDNLATARGDIGLDEIESTVREAIAAAPLPQGKLAQMRDTVLTSATSGVLVQGLIAVANSLS